MGKRFPFSPFPDGWFAVCFSNELESGAVLTRTLFGRDVVVFRTESGKAAVLDAYCPHMGAHMGYGGEVVGESLRCPMHAFRFDGGGKCVATGYDTKPPPTCKGRALHVQEVSGTVFAFHDHQGRDPSWHLPDDEIGKGTRLFTHVYRKLRSHPQETTENSVDMGHFGVVHGYTNVNVLEPLTMDGPYLTTKYSMNRRSLIPRTPDIYAEFHIHVWGLGYSYVDVHVPGYKVHAQYLVLCSPGDGETVNLHLAGAFESESAIMRRLPDGLFQGLVGIPAFRGFLGDVRQDFDVWSNKQYVDPPALAQGDGPVGKYRKWCRQFYEMPSAAAAE